MTPIEAFLCGFAAGGLCTTCVYVFLWRVDAAARVWEREN